MLYANLCYFLIMMCEAKICDEYPAVYAGKKIKTRFGGKKIELRSLICLIFLRV